MGKNVSIKDVAQRANVSIATVSYVLNNTKAVTPETRKAVEDSVKALGYRLNKTARSFKTGRTQLIAFVVPDIANPFFSTLIEEVERILAESDYRVLIVNTKETISREINIITSLSGGVVDGFLIASTIEDFNTLRNVIPTGFPTVFLDRTLLNSPYDTVVVDSYDSIVNGIEYLIGKGHKKIGCITGLMRISTSKERLIAYSDTMRKHNLYDESLIKIGDSMVHCVESKLSELLDSKCTAIFIANNVMATETIARLQERGIRPGKDIEIIMFKDSEEILYTEHDMHMIKQPTLELARTASRQLLKRINKTEDEPLKVITLPASFILASN